MPSCRKPKNATGPVVPKHLCVELVIQYQEQGQNQGQDWGSASANDQGQGKRAREPAASSPSQGGYPGYRLQRTQHRVVAGTTIRQLLAQLPLSADIAHPVASAESSADEEEGARGGESLIEAIEQKARGLSRFGRRAWLDDPLQPDDRIEILCPILADARAARFERVAKTRAGRPYKRSGIRVAT